MSSHRTIVTVLTFLAIGASWGATAGEAAVKDDFKPSTLNQPGQEYPQVNSQGYARFRIVAPQAQSVERQSRPGGQRRHQAVQGRRRRVGRHHGRPAGRRVPLLPPDGGRRHVQRPGHAELLRLHPLGERHRDPGPRSGFLRAEGRAARAACSRCCSPRRAPAPCAVPSSTRRPATRRTRQALSGAVPAARLGRGRDGLEQSGPRQPDHGQPDRRGQNQALPHRDDLRHDQRREDRRPGELRRESLPDGAGGRADPVCRRPFPHHRRPAASGHGRPVDGRHGDATRSR